MDLRSWPCWAKVATVIGLIIFAFNWPGSSGDWASWVQAVGSIGAILVAFEIAKQQARMSEEAQRKLAIEEQERYEISCLVISKAALDRLVSIVENSLSIDKRINTGVLLSELDGVHLDIALLYGVQLDRIADVERVRAFCAFRYDFDRFYRVLRGHLERAVNADKELGHLLFPSVSEPLKSILDSARSNYTLFTATKNS